MRVKNYLGVNVLEAAKKRIREAFGMYDTIFVSFSGGKDSLVVLELTDMVRIEMGIKEKLNVVFFDEELISDEHDQFVRGIAESGRFNFFWIVAPLRSEKFIMGKKIGYIQWDLTREWIRTPPDYAMKFLELSKTYEDEIFERLFKGKYHNVGAFAGVRANESKNRTNTIMKNSDMERPYVNKAASHTTMKPIYDWGTEDVFKFIHDNNIKYASVYDAQVWGKAPLRVATPFTNEGAKMLYRLREYDPKFYDRLVKVFPEMIVQAMYGHKIDSSAVYRQYGITKEGILKYIDEVLEGSDKIRCNKYMKSIWEKREEEFREGVFPSRYPLQHLFRSIVEGLYKRFIHNIPEHAYNEEMMSYELIAKKEWEEKQLKKEIA